MPSCNLWRTDPLVLNLVLIGRDADVVLGFTGSFSKLEVFAFACGAPVTRWVAQTITVIGSLVGHRIQGVKLWGLPHKREQIQVEGH